MEVNVTRHAIERFKKRWRSQEPHHRIASVLKRWAAKGRIVKVERSGAVIVKYGELRMVISDGYLVTCWIGPRKRPQARRYEAYRRESRRRHK